MTTTKEFSDSLSKVMGLVWEVSEELGTRDPETIYSAMLRDQSRSKQAFLAMARVDRCGTLRDRDLMLSLIQDTINQMTKVRQAARPRRPAGPPYPSPL